MPWRKTDENLRISGTRGVRTRPRRASGRRSSVSRSTSQFRCTMDHRSRAFHRPLRFRLRDRTPEAVLAKVVDPDPPQACQRAARNSCSTAPAWKGDNIMDSAGSDGQDDAPRLSSPAMESGRREKVGGLSRRSTLLGIAAVAGTAAAIPGTVAYAGGWLCPGALTAPGFVDRFEEVYGHHNGFRRNHAKGLSVTGTFTSSGVATEICRAQVFARGSYPVIGRFSLSGGVPDQPDEAATVRGLALMFVLPGGEQWRATMVNSPVSLDATPGGFYERLLASAPDPHTGEPNRAAMSGFLARHPETAAATRINAHPRLRRAGFTDSPFWGQNAFRMTNGNGVTMPVRWSLVPQQSVQLIDPATLAGANALFDALMQEVTHRRPSWTLMITVGLPHDPTHDATQPWPADRITINAGTVTINTVQTEAAGNARDISFDPLVLPDGITASDDPLLSARSAVYARSFARRTAEPKRPSAVQVDIPK
jgi:catalase